MPREPQKLGLIAGWGRYPLVVAQSLRRADWSIYCLGLKDHADPVLACYATDFRFIGLGRLGTAIRYLRKHGVKQATLAGKVHKTLLFQPYYWLKHFPDWQFIRTYYPHFVTKTRDRKDDTMLGTLVDALAKVGIHVAPASDYVPGLLVEPGQLCGRPLTRSERLDIGFGWQLARELGRLDIGQTVCVKGRAVLAVEAVEGTDACIRRAGQLCPSGGFTVVKVAKPQQDMRFDVPTVGLGTVRTMAAAQARVLAIEAHKTILIDRPEVVAFCQQHGVKLAALTPDQILGDAESFHSASGT